MLKKQKLNSELHPSQKHSCSSLIGLVLVLFASLLQTKQCLTTARFHYKHFVIILCCHL